MTAQSTVSKKKRELGKKAGFLIKYNLHHINYKIFNVHEKHNYDAKKVYAPYATSLEYIPWLKDKLWLINSESCWEIHGCGKNNLLPFLLPLKSIIWCWNVELKVKNDCHYQKSRTTFHQKSRPNVKFKSQGQMSRSKFKVKCQVQTTGQRQHSIKVLDLAYSDTPWLKVFYYTV